jgi:hypothetical protein
MLLAGSARRAAIVAVALCAVAVTPAMAHDPSAPPGALHSWLPKRDWVMQHWLPFDETRLYAVLGVDNVFLERWLRDDHRTIAELARSRAGIGPHALARRLVASEPASVAPTLRRRTYRVLTEGHLAQHVFFHTFHGTRALERTQQIFGVDRRSFKRMRQSGMTPVQIGRRGGRTPAQVRSGMLGQLRSISALGVRRREHSRREAGHMLRRRTAVLSCFLRRPLAGLDPDSPFGERDNGHGPHARTARPGLSPASKQVRARKSPRCCWFEPPLRAPAIDAL